jgi:hypothetical protein
MLRPGHNCNDSTLLSWGPCYCCRNFVLGLLEREITSTADIDEVIRDCQVHRATGVTQMNDRSSRSHLVIRIIAEFWDAGQTGHTPSDARSSVAGGPRSAPSTARETAFAPTLMLLDLAGRHNCNVASLVAIVCISLFAPVSEV